MGQNVTADNPGFVPRQYDASMTLADFYRVWLLGGAGNAVGPLTAKTRRYAGKRLVAELGGLGLEQITATHVWRFQRACIADGLAVATINLITHTVLRALLRDAAGQGIVEPQKVADLFLIVRQLPGEAERSRHPLSRVERDRLLDAIRNGPRPWGLPLAAWLFATGMRPGEACGLKWEDLDLTRRACTIRRSRYEQVVTSAKTAGSRRTIPLARAAVAALATVPRRAPEDYVFVGARGTRPILIENYTKWVWRPACKAAGFEGRVLYTTRHSFISWQISAGKTPAAVARYCGTSVKVILAHYYEYTNEFLAEEWDDALETRRATNVSLLSRSRSASGREPDTQLSDTSRLRGSPKRGS